MHLGLFLFADRFALRKGGIAFDFLFSDYAIPHSCPLPVLSLPPRIVFAVGKT